jgi:RimJ/RimL family protein N-acetyltransferase
MAVTAPAVTVRCLQPAEADIVIPLRREALASEPLAFGASMADGRTQAPDLLRTSLEDTDTFAIIGAFDGGTIVGMAGVFRMDTLKARHRARIWGMFVTPAARGRGVGAAILRAAVERARAWPGIVQVHLSVTETSEAAARLYRAMGFHECGVEPGAERHLVLEVAQP